MHFHGSRTSFQLISALVIGLDHFRETIVNARDLAFALIVRITSARQSEKQTATGKLLFYVSITSFLDNISLIYHSIVFSACHCIGILLISNMVIICVAVKLSKTRTFPARLGAILILFNFV